MPMHRKLATFVVLSFFAYSASPRSVDTQTAPRQAELSAGPEIDVRSFGAVPDGKTDSTGAIQKATLLANTTGGVVKFPHGAGSYIYAGGPLTVGTPTNKVDWLLEGSDIHLISNLNQDFILLENYSGIFGFGSTWGKPSITVDPKAKLRTVVRNARQSPNQQEAVYIEGISINGQKGAQISGPAAVDLSYLYVPSMVRDTAITNFNSVNLRIDNAGVFLLDNVLAQGCGATYANQCPASQALIISKASDLTSLAGTYQGASAGLAIVTITGSQAINFYSTYYEAGRSSGPSLLIEDSQNVHVDGHLCGGYTDGDCIQIAQSGLRKTGSIRVTNARTNGIRQKLINNMITHETYTADGGFGHYGGDYTYLVREHGDRFIVADTPPSSLTGLQHGGLTIFNVKPDGKHFACFDFSVADAGPEEGTPVSRVCQENGKLGTTLHFLTSNNGSAGVTTDALQLDPSGNATISGTLFLRRDKGSPLSIASTALNPNLNADYVDGHRASDFTAAPVPAPATSSSPCTTAQWAHDDNYMYLCVGKNTWRRVNLSTF